VIAIEAVCASNERATSTSQAGWPVRLIERGGLAGWFVGSDAMSKITPLLFNNNFNNIKN
jgi:hypothetical protein